MINTKHLITLIFLFSLQCFAIEVTIQEPIVTNENLVIQKSFKILIRQAIENQENSISDNSKNIVSSKLIELGKSYLIIIDLKKDKQSTLTQKAKIKDIEELDIVIDRLITAIFRDSTFIQTQQIDNITKEEQHMNNNKIESNGNWYFGIGPGWEYSSNGSSSVAGLIGYKWDLNYHFSLNTQYEWITSKTPNDDTDYSGLSIGGNYHLNTLVHSPYLSMALGYGGARYIKDQDIETNWQTSLGVGVNFFRTNKVNFAIEARYRLQFKNISGKTPSALALMLILNF